MGRPNDTRGDDGARQLARELAERLAEDAGGRTLRLLQMAGFTLGEDVSTQAMPPEALRTEGEAPSAQAISIWQPQVDAEALTFVRPPVSPLGDHYATTRVLHAAKGLGRHRVVWLGESAAAGCLYAPHATPARMLGECLGRDVEVIDLARTNERLDTLVRTATRSRQLAPDVWVVFAGNNWTLLESPDASPHVASTQARQRLGKALRDGGLARVVALERQQLEARVDAALAVIRERAAEAGLPVVWVVPEVNVRDWDAHQPVHRLPGHEVTHWYEAFDRTRDALAQTRYEDALRDAEVMLALDGGLGPTGHRLRARALEGLGRGDQAGAAWRAAVDATSVAGQGVLAAPQAPSWVHDRIRTVARDAGHEVVDLPAIFAEKTGWRVPDRRLFLDYCHLNGEGMAILAQAVAESVCRTLGLKRPTGAVTPVSGAVEATARLGAALHTAHRLAPVDHNEGRALLVAWCREAAEASPAEARTALRAVASARTGGLPAELDAAQAEELERATPLQVQHGWRWPHLDPDVLLAIEGSLDEPSLVDQARLVRHLGVRPEGVELSRAPFLWAPVERSLPESLDQHAPAFLRAVLPRTRLALVTDGRCGLELTVVARRAEGAQSADGTTTVPGLLRISCWHPADGKNARGGPVGFMDLGHEWTRRTFQIPREFLRWGVHCVVLDWPTPLAVEAVWTDTIDRLESGLDASLHPIWGELYSVRCRAL